ncbi:MAG: hypothetical protein ACYDCO_07100 [Armatimonadota bacterium]
MKGLRIALLIAAFAGVGLLSTSNVWSQGGTTATVPQVTSRTATINNMQVGEVLVDGEVVLRIREAAGGYTAVQRAGVVANRLSAAFARGLTVSDVQVGRLNNQAVLMMGENLLVTADRNEARINNSTPVGLAVAWRQNMVTALSPTGGTPTVAGTQESWPAWTDPDTKVVPIVTLGTGGASIGFAQVTGPAERVGRVQSVVQLSAVFERTARVFAFVPSSELAGLNRVQGVAVTALLQYQLVRF